MSRLDKIEARRRRVDVGKRPKRAKSAQETPKGVQKGPFVVVDGKKRLRKGWRYPGGGKPPVKAKKGRK